MIAGSSACVVPMCRATFRSDLRAGKDTHTHAHARFRSDAGVECHQSRLEPRQTERRAPSSRPTNTRRRTSYQ